MTTFMVPAVDLEPWPTLGPKVVKWIEEHLVFGPGDKRGEPAKVDAELQGFIWRLYEVYPEGHPQAGRRRFKRAAVSLAKGSRKTEFAAWIAACELHPDAPVRCFDFDGHGQPLGQGVTDPYIPMMAYTEEQTEELAYGALKAIIENSPVASDFDIGLARIMRRDGTGKAEAVAGSPNAVDGARTTWQHFDETHRMILPKLVMAHTIMLRNMVKRKGSDPWSLETTTAFGPGEGSVAETTWEYARAIAEGRSKEQEPRLFFFHRQANEKWDWEKADERRAAVREAAGEIVSDFIDIDAIVEQWNEIGADKPYQQRVHGNLLVQSASKAFDAEAWKTLANPHPVPDGEWITLGFDGSRTQDATGLIATHVTTGYQWVLGKWERPHNASPDWQVPEDEVHTAVAEAFKRWKVWRMYADPPYWREEVSKWSGLYGDQTVVYFFTAEDRKMARAIQAFRDAIGNAHLSHDGDEMFLRHVANACKRKVAVWADQDGKGDPSEQLWVITKVRKDSPLKIDLAVAAVLSWQARQDALASGQTFTKRSAYEDHSLMAV